MPAIVPPVLHPIAVHVPIMMIPLSAALASYAAWKRPSWAARIVLATLLLAALGAFVAAQLGDQDLEKVEGTLPPATAQAVETHNTLGTMTEVASAALFAVGLLLRKWIFPTRWSWAFAASLWALTALMVVTAWYGGSLVFEQGVNTPVPA